MAYHQDTKVNKKTAELERALLNQGYTYTEISKMTGHPRYCIVQRNCSVYNIDLAPAFAARIKREGIPKRLDIDDAFGYWFSGFFDGEGCLHLDAVRRDGGRSLHYRYGVTVPQRDDDKAILQLIQQKLQIGGITFFKPKSPSNPMARWNVYGVVDLAEVIVPLFDQYPLQTKKSHEFEVWKAVVLHAYFRSCRGTSRPPFTEDERVFYGSHIEAFKKIMRYKPQGDPND